MRLKNKIILPVGIMLIITITAISFATFQQVKDGIALKMLDGQINNGLETVVKTVKSREKKF